VMEADQGREPVRGARGLDHNVATACYVDASMLVGVQDAIVLAQELRDTLGASGRSFGELPPEEVAEALRRYERRRSLRVTKITVRSNLMGRVLGDTFSSQLTHPLNKGVRHAVCVPFHW